MVLVCADPLVLVKDLRQVPTVMLPTAFASALLRLHLVRVYQLEHSVMLQQTVETGYVSALQHLRRVQGFQQEHSVMLLQIVELAVASALRP